MAVSRRATRYLRLTAAVLLATSVVSAFSTSPAYASEYVLSYGSLNTNGLPVGSTLGAARHTARDSYFYSAPSVTSPYIKCTAGGLSAIVETNPLAPGTATGSMPVLTSSVCNTTFVGTTGAPTVTWLNLPYYWSVNSSGEFLVMGGPVPPLTLQTVIQTVLGSITCTYVADNDVIRGTFWNTHATIPHSAEFVFQPLVKTSGPVSCPSRLYFHAAYGPMTVTSLLGGPLVHVN
ncbi:hypothetical protein [Actinomadura mexicana]|uniref:Ig-like domain-containing protein n=1 Tax=Actinomadura mexicana TaxID=134959 RepID=A0A239HUR3_9ACTN|nr:hypothetical protein [Actinomadura mexicana]SNS84858.1 hypothetical protein SAMN06265355_1381 [Actinomadura mexicana]